MLSEILNVEVKLIACGQGYGQLTLTDLIMVKKLSELLRVKPRDSR